MEEGIGGERWKGNYELKWVGLHCRGKSKGCRAGGDGRQVGKTLMFNLNYRTDMLLVYYSILLL